MEKEIDITVKLEQAQALNDIYRDANKQMAETIRHMKHVIIALIIAFFSAMLGGFGVFAWYESQFVYDETSTEYTEEMSTEGDNAYINNVEGSQYNDNATHTEGVK